MARAPAVQRAERTRHLARRGGERARRGRDDDRAGDDGRWQGVVDLDRLRSRRSGVGHVDEEPDRPTGDRQAAGQVDRLGDAHVGSGDDRRVGRGLVVVDRRIVVGESSVAVLLSTESVLP